MSWTWPGSASEAHRGRPSGRLTAWTFPPGRWCFPEYQDAVGAEQLPVQDHERDASLPRSIQGLVQARGLGGKDVGALGDVPVGGCAGDSVVAAELLDPRPVAESPQDKDGLLAAGQCPAPGRGAPQPPLRDQQAGDEAKQLPGHVKRGTIGDHVEPSVAKKFCGKTSSTGTPRPFPDTSRVSASLP
jgi:hypothetical protein